MFCAHVPATSPAVVLGDYYGNSSGTLTDDTAADDWARDSDLTIESSTTGVLTTYKKVFAQDANTQD
jgi:hypothetical protein